MQVAAGGKTLLGIWLTMIALAVYVFDVSDAMHHRVYHVLGEVMRSGAGVSFDHTDLKRIAASAYPLGLTAFATIVIANVGLWSTRFSCQKYLAVGGRVLAGVAALYVGFILFFTA